MKTSSNEIAELIQSLTPKEKLSFKNYCTRTNVSGEPSDYMKLFDIYANGVDVENKLQAISKVYSNKKLTRTKNYLHQQLLQFIGEEANDSPDKELIILMQIADSLENRGLHKQCIPVLQKAKNFAEKLEKHHYVLLLEDKILKAELKCGNHDYWKYYINDYRKKEFLPLLEKISIEQELIEYDIKLRFFMETGDELMRDNESINQLHSLFSPLINQEKLYSRTCISKFTYNICLGYYYNQISNIDKALYFFQQAKAALDANEFLRNYKLLQYIAVLNNLMCSYAAGFKFQEVKEILDQLKELPVKSTFQKQFIQQVILLYETEYHINVRDLTKEKTSKQHLKDLKAVKQSISPRFKIIIVNNISVSYFMDHNFKKALEILNEVGNLNIKGDFKTSLTIIHLYKLILYFELGKADVLIYSIQNTYRFLYKNNCYYLLEKTIIKLLKDLLIEPSSSQRKEIFQKAYDTLLPLKKDINSLHVFSMFNFIGWIKCKIEQKPFHDFMKEGRNDEIESPIIEQVTEEETISQLVSMH